MTRVYPVGHLLRIPAGLPEVVAPGLPNPHAFNSGGGMGGGGFGGGHQGGGQGFFSMPVTQTVRGQGPDQKAGRKSQKNRNDDDFNKAEFMPAAPIDPRPVLVQLVVDMTINAEADNWGPRSGGHGELGSIDLFGENLVIRQTPAVHMKIVQLLNLLSRAVEGK